MVDVKEFVSDVSIPRFSTMLTKKSLEILASAFSDVITEDFQIREIMLHVLTLFPNTGFTVIQNLFVSVTYKSKPRDTLFFSFFQ